MYIYFILHLHTIFTFGFCYFLLNDQNGEHLQKSQNEFPFCFAKYTKLLNQHRQLAII